MSEFPIVQASIRDLGPLRRLEQDCFGEDAWPMLDFIGVLLLPGFIRLKAVDSEKMVGFVACDSRKGREISWILTIGVAAEYRRRGVGRELLHAAERLAVTPSMRLSVRRGNVSAQELYATEGYHQVDVWQKYYLGGEDALVLEKRL